MKSIIKLDDQSLEHALSRWENEGGLPHEHSDFRTNAHHESRQALSASGNNSAAGGKRPSDAPGTDSRPVARNLPVHWHRNDRGRPLQLGEETYDASWNLKSMSNGAAMDRSNLLLTDRDRRRLGRLLTCPDMVGMGCARSRFDLEINVEEADAIPAELAPRSLVTMNSTVALVDVNTGQRRICTLVYPGDRDLVPQSVGVFQQIGRNILGRRVGDIVEITQGKQVRRFLIDSIVYQPEAVGASHL